MAVFGAITFWGLILFGVPVIVGQFSHLFLLIGLSFLLGERAKQVPLSLGDFMSGIATSLVAGLLSIWFGATLSLLVPLWLTILNTAYLSLRRERSQIVPSDLGIVVGYVLWMRS